MQLSKGVNETPYFLARKKEREQQNENKVQEESGPADKQSPAALAPADSAPDTSRKLSPKRVRFQEPADGELASPSLYATKPQENEETATALVSICAGDMLTAKALLAGELTVTHLDSCATHCFVSQTMSAHLTSKGYPPKQSNTRFNVMQGNPLCSTNQVHHVPLSLVREDGSICTWDDCLFLVADAGAPVILCYTLLRLGGIIQYEPPTNYEELLLAIFAARMLLAHIACVTFASFIKPSYLSPLNSIQYFAAGGDCRMFPGQLAVGERGMLLVLHSCTSCHPAVTASTAAL